MTEQKLTMLWFDNEKNKALTVKIEEAKSFFEEKYNIKPSSCEVNQFDLEAFEKECNERGVLFEAESSVIMLCGLIVNFSCLVRPNHILISNEKEPE